MVKTQSTTPTTAEPLGALLKFARDIMRKEKGLNGDLDRLPMLTWIMFLKFLNDAEIQREGEARLATELPYRQPGCVTKSDGELQFTLPDALKVLPISDRGNGNEIIDKFGGADELRNAVNQLQSLLYAA